VQEKAAGSSGTTPHSQQGFGSRVKDFQKLSVVVVTVPSLSLTMLLFHQCVVWPVRSKLRTEEIMHRTFYPVIHPFCAFLMDQNA
jgi:hypothetical protein